VITNDLTVSEDESKDKSEDESDDEPGDEFKQHTSDGRYRGSLSPGLFEIANGEFDAEQDSKYIRRQRLGLLTGDRPHSALLDSIDASNFLMNSLQASATKASKNESTSRFQAHQPRSRWVVNPDDDFNEAASTKRPSNSSKRSLKATDDEVDDQTISHKRLKLDKATNLPNSQVSSLHDAKTSGDESKAQSKRKIRPKFREYSLKSHIDNESGWLDTALQSSETLCQLALNRTEQLSKLIKLETDFGKLLNNISTDDRPQQLRELIEQLCNLEKRRRGITGTMYQDVITDYGTCARLKKTVEKWMMEEDKVSKRIEKSS
jgi:hypothetical protein